MFPILAATFTICVLSGLGFKQAHLVPFCGNLGAPLATAAWLSALIGICDLVGTIASGWLSDRDGNRRQRWTSSRCASRRPQPPDSVGEVPSGMQELRTRSV